MTVAQAARELGLSASTIHRWINKGFLPQGQTIPGVPWQIRLKV